ncbi:nuclear pore complex protein Nup85 isoform X2 [Ixodes scapularis]|uniref:nuclear pore complex protein Nup85 isoform X2 n=1 Tax=Ixodes scapularis TaxID=6945 RepID=UPI001A9EB155|nr:nuclear pore complex protein Nup85 isoform X2 [Ixodes scapularis]
MASTQANATTFKYSIHDAAFGHAQTGFVWGTGNSLLVFPQTQADPLGGDQRSGRRAGQLHDVRWNSSLDLPVTRRLVNESCGVFLELQKIVSESKGEAAHPQLVKISRSYRAILSVCWQSCLEELDATDEDRRAENQAKREVLQYIELIWHLCEILFLDEQPGTAFLTQLQRWAQSHVPESLSTQMKEMWEEESPHLSPHYWDVVYTLLCRGSLDEARKLLKSHPQSGREDFVSLDELLQVAPQGSQEMPSRQLDVWWQSWQADCARRLMDGEFSLLPELETACKILMGDEDTLYELRKLGETWYNYLVTKVTYTRPTIGRQLLAELAEECLSAFGEGEPTALLDDILLAAFRLDLQQVLREASACLDDWWFSAHLADLLFHAGQMEASNVKYCNVLREYLLLEYASYLMSHGSLWQVGVDYLDHCPQQGREFLEAYLERVPLGTQSKALKVVEILERRDMWPVAQGICQSMAVQLQKKGQLGAALTWVIRCKNPTLTSRLADKFLLQYSMDREPSCLDLLENLGEEMLLSDRLTFLAKYREFLGERDAAKAARLLTTLVESQLAPHFFWPVLLRDALHTLGKSSDLSLESGQVQQLLGCLETMSAMQLGRSSKELPCSWQTWSKKEEDQLRQLLTQHLACAVIREGGVSCTSPQKLSRPMQRVS